MEWINEYHYGNSIKNYVFVVVLSLLSILIIRLFKIFIVRRLKLLAQKTKTKFDDYAVSFVEKFAIPLGKILVVYGILQYLELSPQLVVILQKGIILVMAFYATRLICIFVRILIESYFKTTKTNEGRMKQLRGVLIIVDIIIWMLSVIFILDNIGYDITTIIAGMGIGGLAIALAAQNILGDLFNYFVIFFDKPFEIDDFVVIDDKSGTVEHIGIKTTRIKSLLGEEIVIANSDLTNARLHNYRRMEKRSISFTLGVTYQTTSEQLRQIPTLISTIITQQEGALMQRCHFTSYGNFSLNFETRYYIESPDYQVYMDIQQSVNLEIYEAFAKANIEFAYPTQTLHHIKQS